MCFYNVDRHPQRALLALSLLIPTADALSQDISYDYVQMTYIHATVDTEESVDEIEGDGFGFSLSLGINKHLAFTLSVISATFKTFQEKAVDTSKLTTLGFTAHTTLAAATDVFVNMSAAKADITVPDGSGTASDSDYGSVISVGLRHLFTDKFEVEVSGSKTDVFDKSASSYGVDARYYFRNAFSAGFGYVTGENADSFLLNLRMDV